MSGRAPALTASATLNSLLSPTLTATHLIMDTSSARRAIFNRIRTAQNRPAEPTASERQKVQEYLQQHSSGPRPDIGADFVARFKELALRLSVSVVVVVVLLVVFVAVARFLDGIGVPKNAIAWKTLNGLAWLEAGVAVEFRRPRNEDVVGITGTFCAIAETGTLMQLSGPDTYASSNLLPETHIAIVPASRIKANASSIAGTMREAG